MDAANALTTDPPQFGPEVQTRLLATTFVQAISYHERAPSTNDLALASAAAHHGPLPLLVLAERQTAGRGRGANRWWAGEGALTFSLLIDAGPWSLPTRHWPRASLMTGLAVCEALDALLAPTQAGIKWPNDVWVEGRKLCGVLVEAPRDVPHRLVLGIGVNVNNSVSEAPPELQQTAAALCDVKGTCTKLIDVLAPLLQRLEYWLPRVAQGEPGLTRAWQERSLLTGRRIDVDQETRRLSGKCLGIDADGALLVETPLGVERCLSGVVSIMPEDAIPRPPIVRR